jgi:ABC-type Fe3+ transport system permease subunit
MFRQMTFPPGCVIQTAAEIHGASQVQRFTRVTLAMTSLASIVFLVSPGNTFAAVVILDAAVGSYSGDAIAMSAAMLIIVYAVMGSMWWVERFGPDWARIAAHETGRA